LIIVDEEHDASYKQKDPAPRYQGRDAAIMLGKLFDAHILLGSATPSFESYQNALKGKYGLVQLTQRYGGVQMPEMLLVDLKEYRRKKLMQGCFSPPLIHEMNRVLAEKKQIILFQNRRGYSSYVLCEECGTIPKCKHCDVSMTYYKQRNLLVCRYCGAMVRMDVCANCGGRYKDRIPGTERIEEEVQQLFPDSRIARMDLDVLSSKTRFRRLLDAFE
jgi:primosomal protein N' (replication factor Y)